MHAPRNLPILLTVLPRGGVSAECVLLPSCRVTAPNRADAIRAIERLIRAVLAGGGEPPVVDYEVVHIAVGERVITSESNHDPDEAHCDARVETTH